MGLWFGSLLAWCDWWFVTLERVLYWAGYEERDPLMTAKRELEEKR